MANTETEKQTPMMMQYSSIKQNYKDEVVFLGKLADPLFFKSGKASSYKIKEILVNETYRKNYLLEQERKKELINWAYQNNEKLEITYKKFNGETTKRKIQPLSTVYKDKLGEFTEEYIQAYCYLRHEERTFRFDRIKQIEKIV